MYDISWDELLYFIEDVFQCEVLSKNLKWKPVRNPNITRKFFTSAMGFTILEANKYWLDPPTQDNMEPLVSQLLSSSNACQDYVFGIGQEYFCGKEFSWQNFRIFLAFIGEVAAYAVSAGRVLLVDDIALSTALYIKDYLMGWMEVFGATRKRSYPAPSAPSEKPCDPLLSNEYKMGVSAPPPPTRYCRPAPKPPVFVDMESAVRVLPSQFAPKHKLRPVFSTFSTEEKA